MRHLRWMLLALGLMGLVMSGDGARPAAFGDVVYLHDGKKYEGKATRQGDKVRIELSNLPGSVIEVSAGDVSYITEGPVTTRPTTMTYEIDPALALKDRPFSFEHATRPEPIVFIWMRNLGNLPDSENVTEFRRQLDGWQTAAKDRKRQTAPNRWVIPKDFAGARQNVEAALKEAKDFYRKAKSLYGDTPKVKEERKKHETSGMEKLKQAAQIWTDPVLRGFLTGVICNQMQDYRQAEPMFRLACQEGSRVAAFQQGLSKSLMGQERYTEALAAALKALALQPDSRDALQLVRDAAKKVPGTDLKSPVYIEATGVLAQYTEPEVQPSAGGGSIYSLRRTTWLMPGAALTVAEDTLPVPAYDRLTFRQGVAVPVTDSYLAVDPLVLKDAVEVFVQIDSKTIVPARMKRGGAAVSAKNAPPLEVLFVPGYTFTPVLGKDSPKLSKGAAVKVYGLAFFEEMGGNVREGKTTVKDAAADGTFQLAEGLLPGEGAGPVFTEGGQLAGFLVGKTDPYTENGGPDKAITLAQIAPLIKLSAPKAYDSSYGRAKRTVTNQTAVGTVFVVYATVPEKVE